MRPKKQYLWKDESQNYTLTSRTAEKTPHTDDPHKASSQITQAAAQLHKVRFSSLRFGNKDHCHQAIDGNNNHNHWNVGYYQI